MKADCAVSGDGTSAGDGGGDDRMTRRLTSYRCRFCGESLRETFVDLGLSPLCETYIDSSRLGAPESFYPLHTFVCEKCFLVQLPEHVGAGEIFEEYAYFSSYSESWLAHAQSYVEAISDRLSLGPHSSVIEVASNDGYLLQYFKAKGIPALGIEPARNVAAVAIEKGIPTITSFFGQRLARELVSGGRQADLLLGNNVLAHVPDINDFVAGMKLILQSQGVITMEFPHLIRLIEENQFDTIFAAHGLRLFDVEELATHGGSLRVYACHAEDGTKSPSADAAKLSAREADWGISGLGPYQAFGKKVEATKRNILQFLIGAREAGKSIAGYGAPGKGNTLLNYCGIRTDVLEYTVDRNPYKQGKYTPGTRIPILPPEHIRETKPDFLLILPWNLKDEIIAQNAYIREWGGRFVVLIPEVQIC